MSDYGQYQNLISDVASSLIFLNHLSPDTLRLWYSSADIGVIPSYSEQCSYTALEMMQYRLSIVTSNAIGLRDIFQDGNTAFMANIDYDISRFAENIARSIKTALSCSNQILNQMKKNMNDKLDSVFSAETMGNKYLDLIHSLVGE